MPAQHLFRGALRVFFRLRDHHALARRQPVGLDHDRRMEKLEGFLNIFFLGADGVFRGRNAVPLHEFLGEALAGFKLRGSAGRPEDRPAAPLEFVYHSEGERQFGTHDGEVGAEGVGQLHQRVEALHVGGYALGVGRNAAIARRAIQLLDARRLPQLPNHRVFATTATEDEHFHRAILARIDLGAV